MEEGGPCRTHIGFRNAITAKATSAIYKPTTSQWEGMRRMRESMIFCFS